MATSIPFRRELDFSYGEVSDVAPGIRRVIAENPSPFTLYGTGTYVLGRGEVAVIDPGPADGAHIAKLLEALEGETISHILITHTHMGPLAGVPPAASAHRCQVLRLRSPRRRQAGAGRAGGGGRRHGLRARRAGARR